MSADLSGLHATLDELHRRAAAARQRRLLVLSGSSAWTAACAAEIGRRTGRIWLLGTRLPGGIAPRDARRRLGRECDALIVDAWSGIDADALGALSGTPVAGGLMILLTPPLPDWAGIEGLHADGLGVAGFAPERIGRRFVNRLRRVIAADPHALRVVEGKPWPEIRGDVGFAATPVLPTADQREAIAALVHVVTGQRRRPVVLTADRGRGKSAALGLAARELLDAGRARIRITGPSEESVAVVLRHAGEAHVAAGRVGYVPPGVLIDTRPDADLVLVDEAAALPTAQLQALLARYSRIAFATTVHGYEGSGRGFDIRFRAHLDAHTRGWRAVRLHRPIRWAEDDPVEAVVGTALLLDAEPAPDAAVADADPGNVALERIDRDALDTDPGEADLRASFGLLVAAHYRTRPGDLRQLLDAPNAELFVLRHRGAVAAVALVTHEGCFDAGLVAEIVAGRRRPHGHLLAEAIAAHCGFGEGAAYHGARVQRIAVHPAARQRGLGTALLSGIGGLLAEGGVDYLGASFGATPELLGFWFRNGFRPLRLGYRHHAASGEPSALVLAGLSPRGRDLACEAGDRFRVRLVRQLGDVHRDLDVALADRLLAAQGGGRVDTLDARDWADVKAFATGRRAYEEAIAPLTVLIVGALTANRPMRLPPATRALLIRRVLQNRPWAEVAQAQGLAGRKGVEDALREAVARVLVTLKR